VPAVISGELALPSPSYRHPRDAQPPHTARTASRAEQSSIRVIMVARKAVTSRGGKVILVNIQPQIEKVFEIVRALPAGS